MEGDENVERIHDVPRAKEVIIELLDTGVDKTELESVTLRLKKYLCLHDETLVKSGYRSSVPLTVIVGVHDPLDAVHLQGDHGVRRAGCVRLF